MAQQSDDLAILSRAFEDALTDLLLEVLKLRIAGDRIRLEAKAKTSIQSSGSAGRGQQAVSQARTCGCGAPRQAR
jgi:hypothetical protein